MGKHRIMDIILEQGGDLVEELTLTVVPRDIYRKYLTKYSITIVSKYPEIWNNNPYVKAVISKSSEAIKLPTVKEYLNTGTNKKKGQHILEIQLRIAEEALKDKGISNLQLTEFRPYHRLAPDNSLLAPGVEYKTGKRPYWIVYNGWSTEESVQAWDYMKWKALLNKLTTIDNLQCLQPAYIPDYSLPGLKQAVTLNDIVELPVLAWLVQHSHGVITTSGFLSHLAAAYGKPCVVIAGSSKDRHLNSYSMYRINNWHKSLPEAYRWMTAALVPQSYLRGKCGTPNCWADSLTAGNICKKLIKPGNGTASAPGMVQAECMYSISIEEVEHEVMGYEDRLNAMAYNSITEAISTVFEKVSR